MRRSARGSVSLTAESAYTFGAGPEPDDNDLIVVYHYNGTPADSSRRLTFARPPPSHQAARISR